MVQQWFNHNVLECSWQSAADSAVLAAGLLAVQHRARCPTAQLRSHCSRGLWPVGMRRSGLGSATWFTESSRPTHHSSSCSPSVAFEGPFVSSSNLVCQRYDAVCLDDLKMASVLFFLNLPSIYGGVICTALVSGRLSLWNPALKLTWNSHYSYILWISE